jgi:hypothetical protein
MAEGLFENRGDTTGQAPHWDHPDGLGWHLWRRAHSTGLLTQPIQRDLKRFGGRTLMDRAPLADAIRRRWGLGQEPAGYRFHLDLPLFYVHFPRYDTGPSEAQPASTVQPLRRSPDVRSVSVPSRRLPLSEGSGLSKTTQMERLVHRFAAIDTAFARHERDLPAPGQTPKLSLYRQEAKSPGAATVAATDNTVRASAQAGPRPVGHMQPSEQRLVQRNTLASDSINAPTDLAPTDLQMFAPMATTSTYQRRVQDSAFMLHRDRPILRTAMPSPGWPGAFATAETQTPRLHPGQDLPRSVLISQQPTLQRRGEQGAPAWLLQRWSGPFSTPLGRHDQALPRLRPPSPRELARPASSLWTPGSRPEYWLAPRFQAAGRGDTPNAAMTASTYQRRVPDSVFMLHRDRLVLRTAMPSPGWPGPGVFAAAETQMPRLHPGQDLPRSILVPNPPTLQRHGEQGTPAWPLQRWSGPFSTPLGRYDQALPHLRPPSPRELASTASGLGTPESRPAYWLAPRFQAAGRGDTPNAANTSFPQVVEISTHRQASPVTQQTGPATPRDTGAFHAPLARSQARLDNMSIIAAMPLVLTTPVAATEATLLSRNTLGKHLAGSHSTAPIADHGTRLGTTRFEERTGPLHRLSTHEETGRYSGAMVMTHAIWRVQTSGAAAGRPWLSDASQVAEVPGSRQENPVLQRGTGIPHAPWTRSQSRADNVGSVASTPLLLTPPVAGTPEMLLSRTTLWQYQAGGPNPAPTAFTVTRKITMGFGEGQRPLYWPGALQAPDQHGGGRGVGGMWRALASGIASTSEPSVRQLQRRATGARRATSGGDAIPGQGWTLPLHVGLTLHRQPYAHDATLHGFSGRMGSGAGDQAGGSGASLGVMSFVPSYQDHETRLQRSNNAPRAPLHVPTSSPLAPLGELAMRVAAGTMRLATLAFRTVQRHAAPSSEPGGKGGSVRPVEELRSFSPTVSGGSFWVPESSSATGIGPGRLWRHAASSLGGAMDQRQQLLQRHGVDRSVPLIDTTWGETRAAVADDRSIRASTFRALQPVASVLPVLSRTAAVREDSRSDLSVRSSPVLTRTWAVTQAALPILRHVHSRTEPGEPAPSVVMRQAVSDLPLVLLRGTETWDNTSPKSPMSDAVAQTRLQAPTLTPATALPIGSGEETTAVATPTSAPQAQIDPDELAEKVWQQLMHKLTIEQERRGYARWL